MPVDGGQIPANFGLYDSTASANPSLWMAEEAINATYWEWKATGSEIAKQKLVQEWSYIRSIWTDSLLSDASTAVSISDDAAWKATMLAQMHEVTGDPHALADLGEEIAATTQRFSDPLQTQHVYGNSPGNTFTGSSPLQLSQGPYGILYANAGDFASINQYGYVSSPYQAQLAIAAYYYYTQTGNKIYRNFSADTYNWIKQYLFTADPQGDTSRKAQYLVEEGLNLDPNVAAPATVCTGYISGTALTCTSVGTATNSSAANVAVGQYVRAYDASGNAQVIPGTRITAGSGSTWTVNKSQTAGSSSNQITINTSLALNARGDNLQHQFEAQNHYFGKPVRGVDSTFINAIFMMGQLGALLYRDGPGLTQYLTDIDHMGTAMISSQGYARTVNSKTVLCNCRDPFTDAFTAPGFVYYALPYATVDTSNAVKQVIQNTAAAIMANDRILMAGRSDQAYSYTADWSGNEQYQSGPVNWQAAYDARPGVQAGYQQIMTDTDSITMIRAGAMLDDQINNRR